MHQTSNSKPAEAHRRHRARPPHRSLGFLDSLVEATLPPDVPLNYIGVDGPFSYDAELGIKHGDRLGVIPDDAGVPEHPNHIIVMRYGNSYFVRRRRQLDPMLRRAAMYLIGRGDESEPAPHIPCMVIGRVKVIAGARADGVFVVRCISGEGEVL